MLGATWISSADLAATCRMLRVGLGAGLPIAEVFRKQAGRGPLSMRSLTGRVADRIAEGDTLDDAFKPEAGRLPPLFTALVGVGEQTGMLVETLRELEDHYDLQNRLKRNFRAQMFWPGLNLMAAVGVICLMLIIADIVGSKIDPLGIGTGVKAALRLLVWVGSALLGVAAAYWAIANRVRFLAPVERLILKLPVLGPALEALLLSRLGLALRLTLGAGLPVSKSLKLSLDAAASALYTQAFERAKPGLRRGETLTEVMTQCGVFPRDFLDVIANAEEGGQVPEVMERVAKNYQDDAARRLKVLSQLAAWLVYAAVAVMIISMIFRLVGTAYGPLFQEIDKLR